MALVILRLLVLLAQSATAEIREHQVPVDHFSVNNTQTFPLRYFYNTTFAHPSICRIFFVLGGEGAANLGRMAPFVSERLAAEHRASVLHAEHRFYGKSLRPELVNDLGLLTIEQALRDYADLLTHVVAGRSCDVIAVGGSYPGNLAILFRMLYPSLITGAYASSAPIKYLTDEAHETQYYQIVEDAARKANSQCPTAVRHALDEMRLKSRDAVVRELRLCPSEKRFTLLTDELIQATRVHFANLNMASYPLATSHLKRVCDALVNSHKMPDFEVNSLSVLFDSVLNNTQSENGCRDFARLAPAGSDTVTCSDVTGCGLDQDGLHWDWQACTEHVMLIGSDDSMFPRLEGSRARLRKYCESRFGVDPSGFRASKFLFANSTVRSMKQTTTKILFVNGLNDGWTAGCVRESLSSSLVTLEIVDGAHHSEMGSDTPSDTEEMRKVRTHVSRILGSFFARDAEFFDIEILVA